MMKSRAKKYANSVDDLLSKVERAADCGYLSKVKDELLLYAILTLALGLGEILSELEDQSEREG